MLDTLVLELSTLTVFPDLWLTGAFVLVNCYICRDSLWQYLLHAKIKLRLGF
jgi:hypothetical protein